MALTKIGSIGINTGIQFTGVTTVSTLNASNNVLSVGGTVNFNGDVSIGGSVSIGGTLTYEDVTNIDSVGLITARNGIVVGSGITLSKDGDIFATGISTFSTLSVSGTHMDIADSIRHIGDSDAKIRFPSADTFTVETAGSERLRITSAGHLGINTDTPLATLEVIDSYVGKSWSTLSSTELLVERNGNCFVSIVAGNTSSSTLNFGDSDDENVGYIDYDHSDNSMSFRTNATERLRINSAGKTLIGDSTARDFDGGNTPQLQVASSTGGEWARMSSTTYIDSDIGGGIILAHSRNATIGSHTIVQDDDKLGSIFFEGSDGTDFQRGAAIECYVDGTPGNDDMPGRLEFRTTAENTTALVTNLVIDESGRLIAASGRSSPRANYKDTNGDSSTPSFQFETANDDSTHSLSLTYGRNNSNGPELKLAKHRTATIGGNTIVQDSDELGCLSFLGSDGTNFIPAAAIRGVVNHTPGTNDMPGALVFSTTANGASTTTDQIRLNRNGIFDFINSGTGVNFAAGHSVTPNDATVVNNTFDDFEEGTLNWEIHKADGLTTGSNASGTEVHYQKIGSMVYVQGWIRTDSNTSTDNATIRLTDASGNRAQLPFTPSSPGSFMVSMTRAFRDSETKTFMVGWNEDNDDVYVHANQSNNYKASQGDNVTSTNQTNLVIAFQGQYHTND